MNILIIYSYPHHDSLNGKILDTVLQSIDKIHTVKTIDLYSDNFNPVLSFDKVHKRRDLQYDQETQVYRDAIASSDHIIFIFPIWWSGMPAILKGFIDRVFVQNFAYAYAPKKLIPIKLLKGKTADIIVTHDTPYLFAKLVQKDYGNVLKKQILAAMCGIKVSKMLSLANVKNSSLKQRQQFLKKVANYFQKL